MLIDDYYLLANFPGSWAFCFCQPGCFFLAGSSLLYRFVEFSSFFFHVVYFYLGLTFSEMQVVKRTGRIL